MDEWELERQRQINLQNLRIYHFEMDFLFHCVFTY